MANFVQFVKNKSIFFVFLLVYGLIGGIALFHFNFIENNKVFYITLRWTGWICAVLSICFAYWAIFRTENEGALWKRVLILPVFSIMVFMMIATATAGYIVLVNSCLGKQNRVIVNATVIKLYIPRSQKLLDSYEIEMRIDSNGQIIKLTSPNKDFKEGTRFTKEMYEGSLGILYSN